MARRYYIKDVVYGANDGIVTTFAVVAGVVGGGLATRAVLIVGVASLFADGLSMAASNYLGSRSERAVLDHDDGGGPTGVPTVPWISAALTFGAFVLAGAVPLVPYVLLGCGRRTLLWTALATLGVLFAVGASRSIVTKRPVLSAGLEMTLIGGASAAVAYVVGHLVSASM
ncbi:MAG: hypothetical protein GX591_01505 [Planctomycetes bacterium]|nr:hypothetical protein [Planctomycetota bacterium]